MIIFLTVYALIISMLSNGYIFARKSIPLFCLYIFLFLFFNVFAGAFVIKAKSKRNKILSHGVTLLISTYVSVIVSVIFQAVLLIFFRDVMPESFIFCLIFNFVFFWNGLISVFLTSVQLGVKHRLLAILTAFIPVINLVVLAFIVYKTFTEMLFEGKKESLNLKREKQKICKTKYPILFVHGILFRDNKYYNYWGRIPKELENNGAVCFYGNHQSALSTKNSGEEIAKRIKEIVEQTGCEKVNIIAHSKGGLDCRYAIQNCNVSEFVASLTTVNTPHRGSVFAEWLMWNASPKLKRTIEGSYNDTARLLGDKKPSILAASNDLTAIFCKSFNKITPLPENIFCQSVGSVVNKIGLFDKFPFNLSHHYVKGFEGENDGIVGINSFPWGEKFTLIRLNKGKGVSHLDITDFYKKNIKGFDVREFYVQLVSDLKSRGL